jgi:hypothetical protein
MQPAVLDGIPEEELEVVFDGLERRRFSPGSLLLSEGEELRHLYIFQSGIAKVYASNVRSSSGAASSCGPYSRACDTVTDLPAAKLKNFAEGARLVEAGEAAAEPAIREL